MSDPEPEREPRWVQRERIRARGGRRRSGANAGLWRGDRAGSDECASGHPALFDATPAYELDRMPEGGGYPHGFIDLAARLMGCDDLAGVVHLCSGSVRATRTFDLRPGAGSAVRADVRELPIRSSSVRWVMADPPYDQDYAEVLWSMGKQYPDPDGAAPRGRPDPDAGRARRVPPPPRASPAPRASLDSARTV